MNNNFNEFIDQKIDEMDLQESSDEIEPNTFDIDEQEQDQQNNANPNSPMGNPRFAK